VWDDSSHITGPALASWEGLARIWFHLGATQQYYPLLHSAFWAESRLWGGAMLGYHLTNVALHAISACLVVSIVRRLALPGAWLAGLIFALHPVCVEAVAWVSEQKSTLSGAFYLAAALVYLRFDQTRSSRHYLSALLLFALALLSKTVTATLPAALLIVFWWERGRLSFRRDVRPLLAWFALGAAAGLITAWVERVYIGAKGADFALSATERFLLAGRAIWFYASKVVWPGNLIFTYPRWNIDAAIWWQYAFPLGVLVAGLGLGIVARRHRGPLAGFLFFIGTLFPALGFFNVYPFRFSYVADHFQYLASLGIVVPIACGLAMGASRIGLGKPAMAACAAVLLTVLGMLTWRQSGNYADAETLYRATLARNPASWMAHTNLGVVLAENPSRRPEAIAEYRVALHLKPDDAQTHADLGNALAQTPGGLAEAIAEFQTALRLTPDAVQTHDDLGVALSQMPGRLPDAIAEFRTALQLKPDYAEAHDNLGVALTQPPMHIPEAIAEFQAAIATKPDFADARSNLARALEQMPGRLLDAITQFQAALRLNPDDAQAHNDLGIDLAQLPGRFPEAIAEFQAALRIQPDYPEARENLANALVQVPGRLEEAIAEYQTALRTRPDDAEAHNGLGVALAQIPGRMPEAIAQFQAALQLRPDYPEARNNLARALRK
jgi:tetratricopeptide (TPR) repeat protein